MTLPSIYFKHQVRHPNNVLLTWRESVHVPREGERLVGPFGDWTVVSVTWNIPARESFLFIDIIVRDTKDAKL